MPKQKKRINREAITAIHYTTDGSKPDTSSPVWDPDQAFEEIAPDPLKALEEERGKVYGAPRHSHQNIGLCWTGLIQQFYGITLPEPIPDHLVAKMMVGFKNQRSVRVFKEDNGLDLRVYQDFSERFQQNQE